MGWYGEHVLPMLLDVAMDTQHTRRIRARVTAALAGDVIEIGFGTGHNLTHLPAGVTRLIAVELSRSSTHRANARIAASAVPVQVLAADAQRLPLPDASVDAALCTWSLCSIANPVAAVREVRRVLRPGGQLHFVEHGIAPDQNVRRWQTRLNPLQNRFVGGVPPRPRHPRAAPLRRHDTHPPADLLRARRAQASRSDVRRHSRLSVQIRTTP